MNVSMQWLNDYIKASISPGDLAEKFSLHAQEVADVTPLYAAEGLVLGRVLKTEAIPDSKNKKCQVQVGEATRTIVCGAPNVAAGQDVIVADIGATLIGGIQIKSAKINGIESAGMIVSLDEIGLDKKYHQETGIHVLEPAGADSLDALGFSDQVIELELTPNRMDLMSMLGVAYEVSALYEVPLTLPKVAVKESDQVNPVQTVIDTDLCDAYYGRVIDQITIKESPEWLKNRLIAAGIRPINNIVDVTNYVMIDLGQPLHAFDLDMIPSETIRVKAAEADETFTTLDGQNRTLQKGDILITDGKTPIALGGVMGGLDTEVSAQTTRVFLESALFNATRIGQTSRRLDLRSEASLRFERGIAHDRALLALDKAAQMMADLGGGSVAQGISKAERNVHTPWEISLPLSRVNRVLGTNLTAEAVKHILSRLHLEVTVQNDVLTVLVPVRRLDIKAEQDLIEEIGRVYGYNQLPITLPSTNTEGGLTAYQRKRRQIKRHLEGLGLFEAITYSLTHPDKEKGFTEAKGTQVLRPLSEDHQSLRQTLVPSLLDVLKYHHARQMESVHVFEMGHLYLTEETETLALALMGPWHEATWKAARPLDFFVLKGVITHVLELFGVSATFKPAMLPAMHPHQTAELMVDGNVVGFCGAVHPKTLNTYDLKEAFVAEISIGKLKAYLDEENRYVPVSKMPSVKRDIAFIVDQALPAESLVEAAFNAHVDYLYDVEIFDVYTGKPLLDTEKSLALRLYFNDKTGTFKTADIDRLMDQLTAHLTQTLNIRVRT